MGYRIRKVEVWSVVKICFFLFAAFGLLMGIAWAIVLSLFSGVMNTVLPEGFRIEGISAFPLFVGAFLLAIVYGVVGTFFAAIFAVVYNLIAHWAGGFDLKLETEGSEALAQAPKDLPDPSRLGTGRPLSGQVSSGTGRSVDVRES